MDEYSFESGKSAQCWPATNGKKNTRGSILRSIKSRGTSKSKYQPGAEGDKYSQSRSSLRSTSRSKYQPDSDDLSLQSAPAHIRSNKNTRSLLMQHYSFQANTIDENMFPSRRTSVPPPDTEEVIESRIELGILKKEMELLKRDLKKKNHTLKKIEEEREHHSVAIASYQFKIQNLERENMTLLAMQEESKRWKSGISDDDNSSVSSDSMDEELDIMDYKRRVREQRQEISNLHVRLENLEIEMAEESERCEEDLMKMDKLCHDIQSESASEIAQMKKCYEQNEIIPRDKRIKTLTQELLWANENLEKEKAKSALLLITIEEYESSKEKENSDNKIDSEKHGEPENHKRKEKLEETLELVKNQLHSVQEELKTEKEEKKELIKDLESEQDENNGHREMIELLSQSLQNEEKNNAKEAEDQKQRIQELEAKVAQLSEKLKKTEKPEKSTPAKAVGFTSDTTQKKESTRNLRPSLKDASFRRQNSMQRRQKVIENSMQEMDDMIKTMRENARRRNYNNADTSPQPKKSSAKDVFSNFEKPLF